MKQFENFKFFFKNVAILVSAILAQVRPIYQFSALNFAKMLEVHIHGRKGNSIEFPALFRILMMPSTGTIRYHTFSRYLFVQLKFCYVALY